MDLNERYVLREFLHHLNVLRKNLGLRPDQLLDRIYIKTTDYLMSAYLRWNHDGILSELKSTCWIGEIVLSDPPESVCSVDFDIEFGLPSNKLERQPHHVVLSA